LFLEFYFTLIRKNSVLPGSCLRDEIDGHAEREESPSEREENKRVEQVADALLHGGDLEEMLVVEAQLIALVSMFVLERLCQYAAPAAHNAVHQVVVHQRHDVPNRQHGHQNYTDV
jgi:hypothetical protein